MSCNKQVTQVSVNKKGWEILIIDSVKQYLHDKATGILILELLEFHIIFFFCYFEMYNFYI